MNSTFNNRGESLKDFLEDNILLSVFCHVVMIHLAGLVSALLVVSPTGRGDLEILAAVAALFTFVIYFPLSMIFIDAIGHYLSKKNISAAREKIRRKMSAWQIKTNRVEKVAGSLSLASSGGGTLKFSESEGALSEPPTQKKEIA